MKSSRPSVTRVDDREHSAALAGDTTFDENLICHVQGADLIFTKSLRSSAISQEKRSHSHV